MKTYTYPVAQEPCLQKIREEVLASEVMANQNLLACAGHAQADGTWTVELTFDPDLGEPDISYMEVIIKASVGMVAVTTTRQEIFADIFLGTQDQGRIGRILDGLDQFPSVAVALDNLNYSLARYRVGLCYQAGYITADDCAYVLAFIPTAAYAAA